MPFSMYLNSKRGEIKELVSELGKKFTYVSVLATDVKSSLVNANRSSSVMSEGSASECGFVVKLNDGRSFYEYSTDDISGDKKRLAKKIVDSLEISDNLVDAQIVSNNIDDEKLVQSFERPCDFDDYAPKSLIAFCEDVKNQLLKKDENVVNAVCGLNFFTVSKLFISKNKELDQFYSWVNATAIVVYSNGEKMVMAREGTYSNLMKEALEGLPYLLDKLIDKAIKLSNAKPIVPGIYDCITDPSITGLIAHEAFGHGVEWTNS